ncbi:S26 family signal peptidase [Streptomyces goshikiensis]|uniref:S26 family signal peptidase n=1 Tax=Streptomyces goshikiensis TaxID=1942 RepID=UPI00366776B4
MTCLPARSAAQHGVTMLSGGALAFLLVGERAPALVSLGTAATLGAFLAITGTLARMLVVVTVRGASMEPAYRDGDRVLVRRGVPLAPGQVVVTERPAPGIGWTAPPLPTGAGPGAIGARQWLIKRVAAAAGDPVPHEMRTADPAPLVPPARVVLLGDNRAVSCDSRELGYFPDERVLGTVLLSLPRPAGGR